MIGNLAAARIKNGIQRLEKKVETININILELNRLIRNVIKEKSKGKNK